MKTADIKVELLDHMGSDLSIVNAARVSFNKRSEWVYSEEILKEDDFLLGERSYSLQVKSLSDKDARLINYLAKHNHWTPFGHAFVSFRIKAPIFVARQLVKHQVGLVWNEESRRYVDDEPEFYIPEPRARADNVKQGSSNALVENVDLAKGLFSGSVNACLLEYTYLLKIGVAPEVARAVLPLNTMTNWVWSGSLHAFYRVCKLRLDPHTQYETQIVAAYISEAIEKLFPVSWNALGENV